jgi:hypothetical protein
VRRFVRRVLRSAVEKETAEEQFWREAWLYGVNPAARKQAKRDRTERRRDEAEPRDGTAE